MEDIDEKIRVLSERYYRLIASDHHKDRDCHFEIVKRWSYGAKAKYRVVHHGYCHEIHNPDGTRDYSVFFLTYREAAEFLVATLERFIGSEEENQKNTVYPGDH